MTKLKALQQLAEMVEEGRPDWSAHQVKLAFGFHCQKVFYRAYHGSMGSVLSLSESVLHESVEVTMVYSVRYGAKVKLFQATSQMFVKGQSDEPARAWLLAILRALIAIEQQNRDSG